MAETPAVPCLPTTRPLVASVSIDTASHANCRMQKCNHEHCGSTGVVIATKLFVHTFTPFVNLYLQPKCRRKARQGNTYI